MAGGEGSEEGSMKRRIHLADKCSASEIRAALKISKRDLTAARKAIKQVNRRERR